MGDPEGKNGSISSEILGILVVDGYLDCGVSTFVFLLLLYSFVTFVLIIGVFFFFQFLYEL